MTIVGTGFPFNSNDKNVASIDIDGSLCNIYEFTSNLLKCVTGV